MSYIAESKMSVSVAPWLLFPWIPDQVRHDNIEVQPVIDVLAFGRSDFLTFSTHYPHLRGGGAHDSLLTNCVNFSAIEFCPKR